MKFLDQYLDSFEVVFAGSGPEREEIVRTIEADNQMRNANFRGEVDYEEMPELYSSADVSVFPSLKEATSIAALESMASGTPVVATNVGGLTQIIENGREGLLVDPAQPDEIASAVDKLLKSNQYDEYQRNAKQRAENNSWEKMVDEKLPY
ncbi:group 1 glycosyl transferase [Haloferax elongans ATCC BAA-1513]|uniref:Group 1 glycosyl transferase n=2 Tax=Haloferax elongans TaxID=403191 RepID=M0HDB4_HALEO|nr:group 1 glycosyl transferase [Haloferax elongans ATCC BAA-1513]